MKTALSPQGGFSYLALLIFLAVLGVTASATVLMGSIAQRRHAEDALLQTGAAYRAALSSYYQAMPPGQRRYPQQLDDLLLDARFPKLKRHLRQVYPDPITGQPDWQLIRHADGGIMAIASKSTATPIKIDRFAPDDSDFKGKSRYSDWVFTAKTQSHTNNITQ